MSVKSLVTRFRAYQLGSAGSSFSYFDGSEFTLIEARYNDVNSSRISEELKACGKKSINTLHITSWDNDHCAPNDLEQILTQLRPKKIEYPGYKPHTESGETSLKLIKDYKKKVDLERLRQINLIKITPAYISSLEKDSGLGYSNLLLHPKFISEKSNDNSTVKLFRTGSFNILSLGDVESSQISASFRSYRAIKKDVDIMILAHHGADNGFTTSSFLRASKPIATIATSNYDNQFEHPKPEIRKLLHEFQIPLFTTKTGDIIIYSTGSHNGSFTIENLISDNTKTSSKKSFTSKKKAYLNVNNDTLRSRFTKKLNNTRPR